MFLGPEGFQGFWRVGLVFFLTTSRMQIALLTFSSTLFWLPETTCGVGQGDITNAESISG